MIIYSTKSLKKYTLLKSVFDSALSLLNQPYLSLAVNVDFVSKHKIHKINKLTRAVDKPTDVLSFPLLENVFNKEINNITFPFDTDKETGEILLGDILICTSIARKQAKEYGHSVQREIYYLALHGLLHLLGYDHEKEDDKKLMRETEEKILLSLKIER